MSELNQAFIKAFQKKAIASNQRSEHISLSRAEYRLDEVVAATRRSDPVRTAAGSQDEQPGPVDGTRQLQADTGESGNSVPQPHVKFQDAGAHTIDAGMSFQTVTVMPLADATISPPEVAPTEDPEPRSPGVLPPTDPAGAPDELDDRLISMPDVSTGQPDVSVAESHEASVENANLNSLTDIGTIQRQQQLAAQRAAAAISQPPQDDEPAAAESAAERSLTDPSRFMASWEVDELAWPEVTTGLLEHDNQSVLECGVNLVGANREGLHVLAIASSQQREGCSTLALCLARCAAQTGVRVALVDANPANPSLAEQLGINIPASWTSAVADQNALQETAVSSVRDGVTLFALSAADVAAASNDSKGLASVLKQIAAAFELVIVDAGKVNHHGGQALNLVPASMIDATMIVCDRRKTGRQRLRSTVQRLRQTDINIGVVENFVPMMPTN